MGPSIYPHTKHTTRHDTHKPQTHHTHTLINYQHTGRQRWLNKSPLCSKSDKGKILLDINFAMKRAGVATLRAYIYLVDCREGAPTKNQR